MSATSIGNSERLPSSEGGAEAVGRGDPINYSLAGPDSIRPILYYNLEERNRISAEEE